MHAASSTRVICARLQWNGIKLNADVLFAVPKSLLNKLDIRPGAVVWRVERDDIRREGLQEHA